MTILAFLGAAAGSIFLALICGAIAGAAIFVLQRARRQPGGWVAILITAIVVALIAFSGIAMAKSYTTIDRGTVGVVTRFGGVTGDVFQPGLNWRFPFIEEVLVIDTVVLSYETSDNPLDSGADHKDYPITAQTIDGQQIQVKYTVLFRIPTEGVADMVQNIGRVQEIVENVVKARSRNLSRLLAQNYTAEDLYSGEGIFHYEYAVRDALEIEFGKYGLTLDDFLVRKIDFDEDYIRAIEQQQIAEEAIETAEYEADAAEFEKEKQIRLAEAEAKRIELTAAAEAKRIELTAVANAEQVRVMADAEAYSIAVRGTALRDYPELVQWEFVRNLQDVQWGFLPSEGVTPLLPIQPFEDETTVIPTPTPAP